MNNLDKYTIIRVEGLTDEEAALNTNAWDVLYTDANGVEMTYDSGLTLIKARAIAKAANDFRQRHLMNFLKG
jgi:hypothetical protein